MLGENQIFRTYKGQSGHDEGVEDTGLPGYDVVSVTIYLTCPSSVTTICISS